MQVKGKIVKNPIIKDKVIFSAIKESDDQRPMQIVLFKQSRPLALTNALSNVKLNDEVTITGRLEQNPRNNEIQIIIDDIELEYKDIPCPDYF